MSAGDSSANAADHQLKPHIVYTETFGAFHCYVQGNLSAHKVVCVTYHDIGLNHSAFVEFLDTNDMSAIKSRMCFVHINAPGQQDNADKLAENYHFPTMQQLADVIPYLLKEVGVTDNHDLIGFGEGAGANILLRFSFSNPRVLGLILLECTSTAASFKEWGQEKVASWNLTHRGMNPTAEKYLLWHHLGTHSSDTVDIVNSYRANLYERMNAHNLALFIDKFTKNNSLNTCLAPKTFCLPMAFTVTSKRRLLPNLQRASYFSFKESISWQVCRCAASDALLLSVKLPRSSVHPACQKWTDQRSIKILRSVLASPSSRSCLGGDVYQTKSRQYVGV